MTNNNETFAIAKKGEYGYTDIMTGLSWEQVKRVMFISEAANGIETPEQQLYRETHVWLYE